MATSRCRADTSSFAPAPPPTHPHKHTDAREAALLAFKQLCQCVGRPCEPYVVPLLPMMLDRLADKSAPVRDAGAAAAQAVVSILCPHAVELVLPGARLCGACVSEAAACLLRGMVGVRAAAMQQQHELASLLRRTTHPACNAARSHL